MSVGLCPSLLLSLREAMAPSLHWLLLLWGLQGLWAQQYEVEYEEEGTTTRTKTQQRPSNFITQNAKCKSQLFRFFSCMNSFSWPV